MSTTVVLASQGQLGSLILRQLRQRGIDAVGVDIDICNLECPKSIRALFQRFPEMKRLYNAAAFTAVDAAESKPRKAFRTNALGPGFLAATCASRGVQLIHFSTDYVFGEGYMQPITEQEKPCPLSVYGRSKLLGEKLVMQHHPQVAVLRTCGLYSAHRPNFVRTMLRLGQERDTLEVVDDQIVTPTPAESLARVAIEVGNVEARGLFHATAEGGCSWYEFACAIFEIMEIEVEVKPVTSDQWPAPAKRPSYSVLDNDLLRARGLDTFKNWREELKEFLHAHGDQMLAEIGGTKQRARRAS